MTEMTDDEQEFWRADHCVVWAGYDDHGIEYVFTSY
jgi:hypothetical protein